MHVPGGWSVNEKRFLPKPELRGRIPFPGLEITAGRGMETRA